MTSLSLVVYGLVAVIGAILIWLIYEACLDIRAANRVRNGRLAAARVRLVRQVVLMSMTWSVFWIESPPDLRSLTAIMFIVTLTFSEVYLRRAIRDGALFPPLVGRLLERWSGPRE